MDIYSRPVVKMFMSWELVKSTQVCVGPPYYKKMHYIVSNNDVLRTSRPIFQILFPVLANMLMLCCIGNVFFLLLLYLIIFCLTICCLCVFFVKIMGGPYASDLKRLSTGLI